jgi:hypothetical protein
MRYGKRAGLKDDMVVVQAAKIGTSLIAQSNGTPLEGADSFMINRQAWGLARITNTDRHMGLVISWNGAVPFLITLYIPKFTNPLLLLLSVQVNEIFTCFFSALLSTGFHTCIFPHFMFIPRAGQHFALGIESIL